MDMEPSSLVLLASIVVAADMLVTKKMPLVSSQLPCEVIEQVACKLRGIALLNFLDEYKNVMNIKEKFSCTGFQRFLFNIYINLEQCPVSDTKERIRKHLETFRIDYKTDKCIIQNGKSKEGNFFVLYFGTVDWDVASLGLNWNLFKCKVDMLYEHVFFQIKFEEIMAFEKYPCPTIPSCLAHLVCANAKCEFSLPPFVPHNALQVARHESMAEDFFARLAGMAQADRFGRPHEVLAYGIEFLCETKYLKSTYLASYYFYIYGMLALALAQFHVDYAWVKACLKKMDSFVRFYSHRLDVTLYIQQIAFAYQQYMYESQLQKNLFRCVPLSSEFYIQSAQIHFHTCIKHLENGIMKIMTLKRDRIIKKRQEKIETVYAHLKKVYAKTERFLYAQLSKKTAYKQNFEEYLNLLFCFDYLLHSSMDITSNLKCEAILAINMENQNHHLRHFFNFSSESSYREIMTKSKKKFEKRDHIVDCEKWGNLCFTQALFFLNCLSNFSYDDTLLGEEQLTEAMRVYKKTKNPRHAVCAQYFNRTSHEETSHLNTSVVEFDLTKLLSSVPHLAGYAYLGFESIALFNSVPS